MRRTERALGGLSLLYLASHISPTPFAEINMIALLTLALGYTDRGILKLDNT